MEEKWEGLQMVGGGGNSWAKDLALVPNYEVSVLEGCRAGRDLRKVMIIVGFFKWFLIIIVGLSLYVWYSRGSHYNIQI